MASPREMIWKGMIIAGEGLVLNGLTFAGIRDHSFCNIMNQEYNHTCSYSFPSYVCDTDNEGVDDLDAYLRASSETFFENYPYFITIMGLVIAIEIGYKYFKNSAKTDSEKTKDFSYGSIKSDLEETKDLSYGSIKSDLKETKDFPYGSTKSDLQEAKDFPYVSIDKEIDNKTIALQIFREGLKEFIFSFAGSLSVFCAFREALPLLSFQNFPDIRLCNSEARGYFFNCAPIFISGWTLFNAGKKALDLTWDTFSDEKKQLLTKAKEGFKQGQTYGYGLSLLGLFPMRDYYFSKMLEGNGVHCPLTPPFPGFQCGMYPDYMYPEFDDKAKWISVINTLKDGCFYYIPGLILGLGTIFALYRYLDTQQQKIEIQPSNPVQEVRLTINSDVEESALSKELSESKRCLQHNTKEIIKASAKGALEGFAIGALISYEGFYITREIMAFFKYHNLPDGSTDPAFRLANAKLRLYSDSAIIGVTCASALFGGVFRAYKEQKRVKSEVNLEILQKSKEIDIESQLRLA